jgi:hypothetical protein
MEENIKTSKIGYPFSREQLSKECHLIYGGISVPGKQPGFAVVLAADKKRHSDIYLLDEAESFDMRELIYQSGALDFKYAPSRWIGDYRNKAAAQFIEDFNNQSDHRREFSLSWTPLLDIESLYSYILPQIKELCRLKQLFIKEGKTANYLRSIQENEISELELGSYPAIEALAFAVLELRDTIEQENKMPEKPYKYDYDPLNANYL